MLIFKYVVVCGQKWSSFGGAMELNIAGAQRCMSRIMGVVLVFPYYCFACVRICGKNFDCSSSCTKRMINFSFKIMRTFSCFSK